MIISAEEKKFVTTEDLYLDLREKVAFELRKVAGSDPPKKKRKNDRLGYNAFNPATPKKRTRKTRSPFEPPSGLKVKPSGALHLVSSS